MITNNISGIIILKSFAVGALALSLASCDGGSSNGDIAPQSLNGVSLQIAQNQGPTLQFNAGVGGLDENGTESGSLDYTVANQQGFLLSQLSPTIEDTFDTGQLGFLRKWPDNFFNGSYRYTPVGSSSGRLEFFGTPTNTILTTNTTVSSAIIFFEFATLFWGNPTSADPLVMDLSFDSGGTGSIVSINAILTTPTAAVTTVFDPETGLLIDVPDPIAEIEVPLAINGSLTAGGLIPTGFTNDFVETTPLFDGQLSDQPITFIDDVDGTSLFYTFVDDGTGTGVFGQGFGENGPQEEGDFTLTFDPQGSALTPNSTLTGTYELVQIQNTDTFELLLNYDETAGNVELFTTGVLQDGIVELDFATSAYSRPTALGAVLGIFTLE